MDTLLFPPESWCWCRANLVKEWCRLGCFVGILLFRWLLALNPIEVSCCHPMCSAGLACHGSFLSSFMSSSWQLLHSSTTGPGSLLSYLQHHIAVMLWERTGRVQGFSFLSTTALSRLYVAGLQGSSETWYRVEIWIYIKKWFPLKM